MAVIILAFVVVLGLLVSWIIGEAKNVRALRIPGMIAAVLIAISAGHDNQAGSFFLFDMYAAKERLDTVKPPARNPGAMSESN